MNLFRTLRSAGLALFVGLGLSSCLQAPDYAIEPAIDFKELRKLHTPVRDGLAAEDELTFVLNFRDGDGDLGLSADDIKVAPWNSDTGGPNGRATKFNYLIQPFTKDSRGIFVPFVTSTGLVGEYDSRFLRLDQKDAKPTPLRGELRYRLPLPFDGTNFFAGKVLRFEISILDRGLHQSNTITTSEVRLGP